MGADSAGGAGVVHGAGCDLKEQIRSGYVERKLPDFQMLADSKYHLVATIIQEREFQTALTEDSTMAERAKKTTVFLIVENNDQRNKLATGLRELGYDVHDYMTAREFLIDKRHHMSGVVVADYRLLDITGVELCERLAKERSGFPAVLMSARTDVPKVLAGQVSNFIVRPITIDSLQEAITRATAGEVFTDDELHRAFKKLSKREREIVPLVVAGQSSGQIAEELGISIKTVEAHRARIMARTRANDAGHLARLWRAWEATK